MMKIEAKSEEGWPFLFYIEKAVPIEEDGNMIVEGIASTVNVDHDHERFAENALHSMSSIINDKGVPLRLEHSKEDQAIIGTVFKAWVDERNQLWIKAAIEKGNKTGEMIHEALKQGAKFGLSVGGRVRNAVREMSESTGKMVKTFYDVVLDEVSVTRKPANYDAWLFAKSYKTKEESIEPFLSSSLYKEFLFENSQLDYLRQFAKSIPDKAWSKINSDNKINKSMNDENKKDEKSKSEEKPEESTKSFVTKSEFAALTKMVAEGFAAVSKAMDSKALDATNPDKAKEVPAEHQTAKAEDGAKEDEAKKSEDDADDKKEKAADGAKDQAQPGKDKPTPKEQQTAKKLKVKSVEDDEEKKDKSAEDDKKEDAKEKAEDGAKEDEAKKSEEDKADDKKEKAADDKKDDMEGAMKSIENLVKRMSGDKVSKSENVEKSAKDGVSAIDRFSATVASALELMQENFEKSGTRIPGLAQMMADMIKNDPAIQSELAAMIKMPGFKKSVSVGIPYMVAKDGKRFALSATPVEEKVSKSATENKTFKSVYQANHSAFRTEGE